MVSVESNKFIYLSKAPSPVVSTRVHLWSKFKFILSLPRPVRWLNMRILENYFRKLVCLFHILLSFSLFLLLSFCLFSSSKKSPYSYLLFLFLFQNKIHCSTYINSAITFIRDFLKYSTVFIQFWSRFFNGPHFGFVCFIGYWSAIVFWFFCSFVCLFFSSLFACNNNFQTNPAILVYVQSQKIYF